MTAAAEKALAEAVATGDLTKERKAAIGARLRERIAAWSTERTLARGENGTAATDRRGPKTATL
jgi:hypothetical protein